MNEKISIILPIFNVGPHLKGGIDSLINQTIGNENLEIIMVDDCSTDESGKIIDEYSEKYECCRAIHLEKNTGAANGPRNRGIEESSGDYIMFLDPDDRYTPNCCERLYKEIKKYDAEIAFGRFRRVFTYGEKVQKSYSPYLDNLEKNYPDETFEDANPLNVSDFIWNNILEKILYGKDIEKEYKRDKPIDVIYIDNIEEEPDILKIPPSVWTKLYKRELIIDNNIRFPPYVCGDDMSFAIETFLKAKGIVFLNNFICYDYYIRDLPDDKSITNNVNVRFLGDLMDAYTYCRNLTENFSPDIQTVSVTPHLLYWMNTWKNSPFTKEENKLLLEKVNNLKKIHKSSMKTKLILSAMTKMLETSINTKKE